MLDPKRREELLDLAESVRDVANDYNALPPESQEKLALVFVASMTPAIATLRSAIEDAQPIVNYRNN